MYRFIAVLGVLALFAVTDPAVAQEAVIGHVKTVAGTADSLRGGDRTAAEIGAPLFARDAVETGPDGSIGITLVDNSVFSAGPNTQLELAEFAFDSQSFEGAMLASIGKGTVAIVSGDIARGSPDAMRVKTPTANLAVRGTRFLVRVGQ